MALGKPDYRDLLPASLTLGNSAHVAKELGNRNPCGMKREKWKRIWTDVSERGTTRSKILEHTQQGAYVNSSVAIGKE